MQIVNIAKRMYDAYCDKVGNVAFDGKPLPKSEEFFSDPEKVKQANAWLAAAEVAVQAIGEDMSTTSWGYQAEAEPNDSE